MDTGFFAIIYKQRNKCVLWRVKKIKKENNEFPSVVEPPHIHIQHMEPTYHTDVHPHAHTHSHASTHAGSHSGIPPHRHPHSHSSIPMDEWALTLPKAGMYTHTRPHTSTPQASTHSHSPTHPKGQGEQRKWKKVLPMRSRRFTRLSTSATDVALN